MYFKNSAEAIKFGKNCTLEQYRTLKKVLKIYKAHYNFLKQRTKSLSDFNKLMKISHSIQLCHEALSMTPDFNR